MQYKDYYQVLGVEHNATDADIKRAYRKMARKYHPDVSKEKDSEERFKEVREAYEALNDPQKRAIYNQLAANWQINQDFRSPSNGENDTQFYGNLYKDRDQFKIFRDMFFKSLAAEASQFTGKSQFMFTLGVFRRFLVVLIRQIVFEMANILRFIFFPNKI